MYKFSSMGCTYALNNAKANRRRHLRDLRVQNLLIILNVQFVSTVGAKTSVHNEHCRYSECGCRLKGRALWHVRRILNKSLFKDRNVLRFVDGTLAGRN